MPQRFRLAGSTMFRGSSLAVDAASELGPAKLFRKPREAVAGEHGGTSTATAGGGCGPADSTAEQPCHHDTSRIAWAKLLARLGVDFPLECPSCGGDIRLVSFITQPRPIRKMLEHVGEPLEPPYVTPARGPPVDWDDLVRAEDDGSLHQSSPDDLPMIDIHRR